MSIRIAFLLVVGLMVTTASAQPNALWEREYDFGEVRTEGRAVAATDDGGFLIAGLYETGGWVTDDILLIRTTSEGDTLWTRVHDLGGAEWVEAMVRTSDGDYVICYRHGYNGYALMTKINGLGDSLWTYSLYNGSGILRGPYMTGSDCMVATDDGGVIACGYFSRSEPPHGGWAEYSYVCKVRANGSLAWETIGEDAGIYISYAIANAINGSYLVAARQNYYIPRLVVSEIDDFGDYTWSHLHSYLLYYPSEVIDVLPLDVGYAVCYGLDSTVIQIMVDRVDTTGQIMWHQAADSFLVGSPECKLLNTPSGDIILCGPKRQEDGSSGFGLAAWSGDGEYQWSVSYGGAQSVYFCDALMTANHTIILAGYTRENDFPFDERVYLVRTESILNSADSPKSFAESFSLHPAYPNPFNPSTTIAFALPVSSPVSLTVYNLAGRKVETLVNGQMNSGTHTVTFDGSRLSSGTYFYTLTAGSYTATNKMLLLK